MYIFFVDLKKAYDRVPRDKLWAVLLEYDVRGRLLAAIESLYKQSEVCVRVNGMKTKPFSANVGLQQYDRAVFFPLSCSLLCIHGQDR